MNSEFLKRQEEACKDPYSAYLFAKDVPGADIKGLTDLSSPRFYSWHEKKWKSSKCNS